MEIIYRLPAMPRSSRRRGAERSARGSRQREACGARAGPAERRRWGRGYGVSCSPRVRVFGPSREEAAWVPVRPRGRPGAASLGPGGALRREIPPREGSGGCGRGRGRSANSSPPVDAMLIGGLSAAAPGAAFPSCWLLLGGETGVSSAREEKKAKQTNGLADAERSRPVFPTEKQRALRKQESAAPAFPTPHVLPPPPSTAAERPTGAESRRAGAERRRCGSQERCFGGAGGQWLSTAVPVLPARGSGASAGN